MKFKLALLCAIGLASANAMACYTVYDRNDNIVYQGEAAPVDMSRQLHETLGRSYPGMQLVFDQSTDCRSVIPARPATLNRSATVVQRVPATQAMGASAAPTAALSQAGGAPLLTDRRTARSLNLPYQEMSGEIVMVPAEAAPGVRPGVTVVPRGTIGDVTSQAPAQRGRTDLVITELRNPRLTIVESNGMVVSAR